MYRVGVIGVGYRGRVYIEGINNVYDDSKVVALCDMDKDRAVAAGQAYGIEAVYTDYHEMFRKEDLDGCIICTPDFTHKQITIDALQQGMHVLCEKPMALTLEDCIEMESCAKANHKYISLGLVLRYNYLFEKMKELISKGEIGNIVQVIAADSVSSGSLKFFHDWHRVYENTKGLLLQKAVHSIDLINWMVDAKPQRIYALGDLKYFGGNESNEKRCYNCEKKDTCKEYVDRDAHAVDYGNNIKIPWEDKCAFAQEIDVNDNEQVSILYENGVKAFYNLCQFTPDYKREFTFIGDKGRLYAREGYEPDASCEIQLSHRWSDQTIVMHPVPVSGKHGGGDAGLISDFILSIKENRKPLADGMTGILSTAITSGAEDSMRTGMPVNIDLMK